MSGLDWADDALCAQVGVDLFFPDPTDTYVAKRICQRCDVMAECLEWALRVEEGEPESYGIYGGLAARQRRKIIVRRRRLEPAA